MLKKEKLYLDSLVGIMLSNLLLTNLGYCFRWNESLVTEFCQSGITVLSTVLIFALSKEIFDLVNELVYKRTFVYLITIILSVIIGLNSDGLNLYLVSEISKIGYILLVGYVLPYTLKEKEITLGLILVFTLSYLFVNLSFIEKVYHIIILSFSLSLTMNRKYKKLIVLATVELIALIAILNSQHISEVLLNTHVPNIDTVIQFLGNCKFIGYTHNLPMIYNTLYDKGLLLVIFTGSFGLFAAFFMLFANVKVMLMSKDIYMNTNNSFVKFTILNINMIIVFGFITSLFCSSHTFTMFGTNTVSDVLMLLSLCYFMNNCYKREQSVEKWDYIDVVELKY